jgi:hypothetical protein
MIECRTKTMTEPPESAKDLYRSQSVGEFRSKRQRIFELVNIIAADRRDGVPWKAIQRKLKSCGIDTTVQVIKNYYRAATKQHVLQYMTSPKAIAGIVTKRIKPDSGPTSPASRIAAGATKVRPSRTDL